jgi:hypothetical protein
MPKHLNVRWTVEWLTVLRGSPGRRAWPQHLAHWLRLCADCLDGGRSYVVHCDTDPAVTTAEVDAAVRAGMEHAQALMVRECHLRALDAALLELRPELAQEATR